MIPMTIPLLHLKYLNVHRNINQINLNQSILERVQAAFVFKDSSIGNLEWFCSDRSSRIHASLASWASPPRPARQSQGHYQVKVFTSVWIIAFPHHWQKYATEYANAIPIYTWYKSRQNTSRTLPLSRGTICIAIKIYIRNC